MMPALDNARYPIGVSPATPGVWIVIAAHNEASVVGDTVNGLGGYQVVVVDDGSSDDTEDSARASRAHVLHHAANRGQGAALQTGIDFALSRGARVIVTFDADGQHRPADVEALLGALDAGADIALGSRFLGNVVGASRGRLALLRAAVWVSNWFSGLNLTDAHCGLRAFRSEVAPKLVFYQDRMAHASELLANIKLHKLRCTEVPVTILYSAYSIGKGQRASDGIRILFEYLVGLLRAR